MKTQKVARIVVNLKTPKGVHNVIAFAKTLVAAIADNPGYFATPTPSLAAVNASLAALESAETAALLKTTGAVATRDAKLRVLLDDLIQLKSYVQVVANPDPANAESIAKAATLSVRKARSGTKQDLTVKQGAVSGTVQLTAKAVAARAAYWWQWSLDQKAWTDLPVTLQARTTLVGLSVPVAHYFRFRAVSKTGGGDWSQVVSFTVK